MINIKVKFKRHDLLFVLLLPAVAIAIAYDLITITYYLPITEYLLLLLSYEY